MSQQRRTLLRRFPLILLSAFFAGVGTQAFAADTYNLILKQNGTPLTCAVGSFSFTKTTTGSFPASGTTLTMAANCVRNTTDTAYLPGATFNQGTQPNVVVRNITMNGENQGANVDGLVGTNLHNGGAANSRFTLILDGNAPGVRTFQIKRGTGGQVPATLVATGTYYFVNTKNVRTAPIGLPEPSAPLLLLAGLGAFALVRGRRRSAV